MTMWVTMTRIVIRVVGPPPPRGLTAGDGDGVIDPPRGASDPAHDGRAMAVMLDGVLLDRLAHPHQDQEW
jgi:hypothetical protein